MEETSGLGKRLVDVLVVVALVALGYLGYKLVPSYIDHYGFENKVREVVVAIQRNTRTPEIKRDVIDVAQDFDVDLTEDDITVSKEGTVVSVHLEYERYISIPFTDKEITLHFSIDDEKDLSIW